MTNTRAIGLLSPERFHRALGKPVSRLLLRFFTSAFLVASSLPWLAVVLLCHDHAAADPFRLATFSADVTIPLGHRCMGVLPTKSTRIVDPLQAHGFVLLGGRQPIVLCAVDWCEIRNESYDQWRDALAAAAGTTRERVLVSCLHQHDAPVIDAGAAQLLADVGLKDELYDEQFHSDALRRVAAALKTSLDHAAPVTHVGVGQAVVERVASNRRVVLPDGRVSFGRGSRGGADRFYRQASEGEIDPTLKTLSFWNGDRPILALHAYATHPMSYYGRGEVSADFVGLARKWRRRDEPEIHQFYVAGCSGDVTAGKYNDGSEENRPVLAQRLYDAMAAAWNNTRRIPLANVSFRNTQLRLAFHPKHELTTEVLESVLADESRAVEQRILAAMGLSSRRRVEAGRPIDVPCVDFGPAQLVLLPGEAFVAYQLMARRMRPDAFVVTLGYGECWPGYIPTEAAFQDGFDDTWLWVGPGAEARMAAALREVLRADDSPRVKQAQAGQQLFAAYCAACHQLGGQGAEGRVPPLNGSPWVSGPESRLIRIVLHGLRGPIEIAGQTYNLEMPAFGPLFQDEQIAAMLTYVRQQHGAPSPPITAMDVGEVRQATRDRAIYWTVPELLEIR